MSSKNKNNKVGPFKHYTTLRAFLSMVDTSLENVRKGNMEVHLSRIDKANDMEEMSFLMDKIKEISNNKKKLEAKIKGYFQKNGFPTYMSFSYPNESTISNEIPMWNMYSRHKGSPGVCLCFEFDHQFYDTHLIECKYINKDKIKKEAETFHPSMISENLIKCIITESVKTKSSKWKYEKEYRLIQFCKDFYHYAGAYEYVEYDKFLIPLKYLTSIIISPYENAEKIIHEIEMIRENLQKTINDEHVQFDITSSSLKIRKS